MAEFNLSVGMTKEQVLTLAQKLNNPAKIKVVNFFNNDADGKISHENELAILNSVFDGSGNVKMPEYDHEIDTFFGNGYITNRDSEAPNGYNVSSILFDKDGDGYADEHTLTYRKNLNGNENMGWSSMDSDFDGVADKKEPFHYKSCYDENGEFLGSQDLLTGEFIPLLDNK